MLERYSPFDLEAVLGAMHAAAATDGELLFTEWMPLVLPDGLHAIADDSDSAELFGFLVRTYFDVRASLRRSEVIMPREDDASRFASFAKGFVAAAELCSAWRNDATRWKLAAWAAYLADRFDLVPESILRAIRAHRGHEAAVVRREAGSFIIDARDAFAGIVPRIGRNEPCPCGSGKKYKRCCSNPTKIVN